ncbi:restriction endonuclease subunit M [Moraxella haemolytica]|uniref:restriction endonuclease subunit M n=1 Tax=Moraxella haemolytica TaxID=2904119 RepID=UPI002542BF2A|nr:restriction endonuclease subunit M [Moraxella sp. ZY171148]WII95261.1 restriction endonuclease subunit M [Moraxella sp. ZY171148]
MNDTATSKQVKSKARIANFGEVFTAEREVNAMLDLVKFQSEQIASTFLEPACGNGNFLAQILQRKLATVLSSAQINKSKKSPKYAQGIYERNAILAISSIYGLELLQDNCTECRSRLLAIFSEHYAKYFNNTNPVIIEIATFLLHKNIINGDALTLLDKDKQPIVFCEWKFISDTQINRRDYIYRDLVNKVSERELPLFSDLGEKAYIPTPIKEYAPIHYLNLTQLD